MRVCALRYCRKIETTVNGLQRAKSRHSFRVLQRQGISFKVKVNIIKHEIECIWSHNKTYERNKKEYTKRSRTHEMCSHTQECTTPHTAKNKIARMFYRWCSGTEMCAFCSELGIFYFLKKNFKKFVFKFEQKLQRRKVISSIDFRSPLEALSKSRIGGLISQGYFVLWVLISASIAYIVPSVVVEFVSLFGFVDWLALLYSMLNAKSKRINSKWHSYIDYGQDKKKSYRGHILVTFYI